MTEQWKDRIFTDSIDLIDVDVDDFPFVLAYSHFESVRLPSSKVKGIFHHRAASVADRLCGKQKAF
jgi:hypothetical protein